MARRKSVREQIIEAGRQKLLERGFNSVGVQEIADTAGVPKGSFYNHFDSKEALGAEIVQRYGEQPMLCAALLDRSSPPLERLRNYFQAMTKKFVEANYSQGCLVGNFSAELSGQSPLIRKSLEEVMARWTNNLEVVIREGQVEGSIPERINARDLAAVILDSYQGTLLRTRVERSGAAFDRFFDLTFQHLLA